MTSAFIVAADVQQKAVGLTILVVALLLWLLYVITENRRTPKSNVESFLGAPNRKAPPEDEEYEGPRLDRFLGWALIGITLMAVALPAYFLAEPGRKVGAIRGFDKRAVHRGEESFGPEHNGFNCASCHGAGGVGGVAKFSVAQWNDDGTPKLDPDTGKQALKSVAWVAPSLKQVALRYRKDQLTNVLTYGRGANKPMPAWGVPGGGPANPQQISDLVAYLRHLAIEENDEARAAYDTEWKKSHSADKAFDKAMEASAAKAQAENTEAFEAFKAAAKQAVADENNPKGPYQQAKKALDDAKAGSDAGKLAAAQKSFDDAQKVLDDAKKTLAASDGELLFNANCARCHTKGYSYGEPGPSGNGFYGPKLTKEGLTAQFPDKATQTEFIKNGVDNGKAYGTGGVNHYSGGGMPYFGNILTDEQIQAIVDYERSL